MKKPIDGDCWYFVDETGDPVFYDEHGNLIVGTEGCSPILGIGFFETDQPTEIRRVVAELHDQIAADKYLKSIPSIQRPIVHFMPKMMLLKFVILYIKLLPN